MATTQIAPAETATPIPQIVAHEVARPQRGWISWLTTTDHKRIGIMYLVAVVVFFMLGGVEALLMRLQLAQAGQHARSRRRRTTSSCTMHGTTMVFLFVVPMMAGFGNYFVPLMIGARDMAFPRLNALSFWLFLAGGVVLLRLDLLQPARVRLDLLRAAVGRRPTRRPAASTRGSS